MALLVALILALTFAIPAASAGKLGDKLDDLRDRIKTAVIGNEDEGELKTLEELNKISDDLMTSLYGGPEEEGAAE